MSKLDELASAAKNPSSRYAKRPRATRRRAKPDGALCVVSFLFPFVGLILGLVFNGRPNPKDRANSSACLTWALVGFLLFPIIAGVLWIFVLGSIWLEVTPSTEEMQQLTMPDAEYPSPTAQDSAPGSPGPASDPERSTSYGESSAGAPLMVKSWDWKASRNYAIAEGEVTNVSGRRLKDVLAVVSFYDASGELITSDYALTGFNPIMPGQTSPFKVMATWNPAMRNARLRFRHLMGTPIAHESR